MPEPNGESTYGWRIRQLEEDSRSYRESFRKVDELAVEHRLFRQEYRDDMHKMTQTLEKLEGNPRKDAFDRTTAWVAALVGAGATGFIYFVIAGIFHVAPK